MKKLTFKNDNAIFMYIDVQKIRGNSVHFK